MTPEPEKSPVRRRDAVRYLASREHLSEVMQLARQPSLRNSALAGLQAAATFAIAMPLVLISPWPHMIGFAALGALVALFGRFAPERQRGAIVFYCAVLQTMSVGVMSLAVWLGATPEMLLGLLALLSGIFYFLSVTGKFGPPGAIIFIFAAGAAIAPVDGLPAVFERVVATGAVAVLAWLICTFTEAFRHKASDERPLPAEPSRPLSHRLIASLRVVIGAGLAAFGTYALGMAHPAWAAMGAVAVLQGSHLHISMNRAVQRMVGTAIGAVGVWLILQLDPSVTALILLLMLLQFATEIVIGFNYALGQILVTPMALLMSYLAAPQAGPEMAPERLIDTLIGVTLGMVIAVLLSTLDDRAQLAQHRGGANRP
jgi:hypothetical protein